MLRCWLAQVERIIEDWRHRSGEHDYLVKWCGLEYVDCTWETEEEVTRDGAGRVSGACRRCKDALCPSATDPSGYVSVMALCRA